MTDNAKCYTVDVEFQDALAELGARHILTPPYTSVERQERFFGTLEDE